MVKTAGVEQTANCATISGSEKKEMTTATNINNRDTQHKANVVKSKERRTTAKGPQDNSAAVEDIFSHHFISNSSGIERQTESKQSTICPLMEHFLTPRVVLITPDHNFIGGHHSTTFHPPTQPN